MNRRNFLSKLASVCVVAPLVNLNIPQDEPKVKVDPPEPCAPYVEELPDTSSCYKGSRNLMVRVSVSESGDFEWKSIKT